MTDFLVSGPLSLDEIMEAIRVQSRDPSGSSQLFPDTEIKLAIRQAILNSHGLYYTTATTTLAFTAGTLSYTLNDDVEDIVLITRERNLGVSGNTINSISSDGVVTSYRHFNLGRGSNKLLLTRDYPTCTFTIWYQRNVAVPIDNRTLGAALTSAATTMTLVDANPQLFQIALPAYFKVDNEIIKVTAVSGNTSATVVRGQLGSTAAAHSNGRDLSQVPLADTDRFYAFLLNEAGRLLNEWRVQAGSGNIDVAANITAQRMFGENVANLAAKQKQPQRSRRMKFARDRRPRRHF